MSDPTPSDYALIFESHKVGAAVLEELIAKYGGNPYVKGGQEADRQTAFNAGKLEVINFILRRLNQANGVSDDEPIEE